MNKLAVSAKTSRLAVYKCLVAAELSGVELQLELAKLAALKLADRLPTLVDKNGFQLFGEHAIVRYIGRTNMKLDDSLEGCDWIELDQKVSGSIEHAPRVLEEKMKARANGSDYLVSKSMGVADVCIGCTLSYAKSLGMSLGPVSASWLETLSKKHPAFDAGWKRTDELDSPAFFSFLENRTEQKASIFKVIEEICSISLSGLPKVGEETQQVLLSEGNKQIKKGCPAEYQLNNAMSLYKLLQAVDPSFKSPRDVAVKLEEGIKSQSDIYGSVISKTEIAGPGFINLYLSEEYVSQRVKAIIKDKGLRPPVQRKRKIGVDFSSPNIAKEMHVGHLRSTIIGEVLCRMFEFCGNEVQRINHVGDWGTQFGMLLTYMRHNHPNFLESPPSISDLDAFYRAAKKASDASEEFKEEARLEVVQLQSGNPQAVAAWKQFIGISERMLFEVYERLNVSFPDGLCGESFYNSRIPAVVEELTAKGLVKEDDGAKCIFTSACPVPLFLVKSNGGYGYDSTDMAAIKYRIQELGLDWVVYVVDQGQGNHFQSVFEAAGKAGWMKNARVDHVGFGLVCGSDGKRFRTREGNTVRLVDLLDEAKNRMVTDLTQRLADGKTPLREDEIDMASAKLGYSAIKYADLKNSREKNYVFDYDAMLASDGDTAVYLIYSYARICNIQAKVAAETKISADEVVSKNLDNFMVSRENTTEWELAVALLRFPECLERSIDELRPHHLCKYVYELASTLAKFYGPNRILLRNEAGDGYALDPANGAKWLILLEGVKIALLDTFYLLGIDPLDRV